MKDIKLLYNIKVHPSWNDFIYDNDNLQELQNIENNISAYNEHHNPTVGAPLCKPTVKTNTCRDQLYDYNYFPTCDRVFRFLENDLFSIRYIILGMDPYPSYYIENDSIIPIATGRSFEVSNIKSWKQKFKQKSLAEILKTLYYDKYKIVISIADLRNKIIEININTSNKIIDSLKTTITKSNNNVSDTKNNVINITISQINSFKDVIKKEILQNIDLTVKDLDNINKDKKIILFNPSSFYDITELQGVLWLNSTLTVKPNESGSHMAIWNNYMNKLFEYIKLKNNSIKYLVFGEQAKNRIIDIIDKDKMIITCHPASRVNNDFITSDCFKELKDILLYL